MKNKICIKYISKFKKIRENIVELVSLIGFVRDGGSLSKPINILLSTHGINRKER